MGYVEESKGRSMASMEEVTRNKTVADIGPSLVVSGLNLVLESWLVNWRLCRHVGYLFEKKCVV